MNIVEEAEVYSRDREIEKMSRDLYVESLGELSRDECKHLAIIYYLGSN